MTFDANGNIETQKRYGEGASDLIDDLTYKYNVVNGQKLENRLYHLNDTESASSWTDDLDDQDASGVSHTNGLTANSTGNYRYDKEGRLVKDIQEDIDLIIWRVDGKVKKIIRPLNSAQKNVSFDYDPMGNRIAKHVYSSNDILEKSTYYVLDAQGNTISVYEREVDNTQQTVTYAQAEKHIYGSSRLGVLNTVVPMLASQNQTYSQATWTHSIGERTYEISNHLGNVLSVISDKPIPHVTGSAIDYYMADLRRSQDYSPFGVTLEGRGDALVGAESYRYGFNGKEKDDAIKGKGNSYDFGARMNDPRVGRFLSLDPAQHQFPWQSPYVSMDNNPIKKIDPDGETAISAIKGNKVVVSQNYYFYGKITKKEARAIAKDIRKAWNKAHGKVEIDGKKYKVKFKITAQVITKEEVSDKMKDANFEDNFISIGDEPSGISHFDGNAGWWNKGQNRKTGGSTFRHEPAHGFGMHGHPDVDDNGEVLNQSEITLDDLPIRIPANSTINGVAIDPSKRKVMSSDIDILDIGNAIKNNGGKLGKTNLEQPVYNNNGVIYADKHGVLPSAEEFFKQIELKKKTEENGGND